MANGMAKDAIKQPSFERRIDLAGKTVYSRGFNIHYGLDGYHAWRENVNHASFKGTTKSAHAQPIEDAEKGLPSNENWAGLVYWNHGNPNGAPLTEENEAMYRAKYYAEIRADDEARLGTNEDEDEK